MWFPPAVHQSRVSLDSGVEQGLPRLPVTPHLEGLSLSACRQQVRVAC